MLFFCVSPYAKCSANTVILFVRVVVFYNIFTNIHKFWTIAPRGNTGLGFFWFLVTTFLSTDQCITLLLSHFTWNCWFIYIDLEPTLQLMPEQSLLNTQFLYKAHHSLLVFRDARQNLGTMPGTILDSKISNKKHRKANNRHQANLVYSMNGKTRRQRVTFVWPQLGMCILDSSNFLPFCVWPQKTTSIDSEVTNKVFENRLHLQILNS